MGPILLTNLSVRFKLGQLAVVMGPSGAGKSTLLRAISDSLSADYAWSGNIVWHIESIVFVRQHDLVEFENLTGVEVLRYMAGMLDTSPSLVQRSLRVVERYSSRRVHEMSGGQRKLLAISIALLKHPSILVLDEPTSGLDSPSALALFQVRNGGSQKIGFHVSLYGLAPLSWRWYRNVIVVPVSH